MRWLKESLIRSRALSYQPRQLDVFSDPHTPAVSWMVRKESNCARLACRDQWNDWNELALPKKHPRNDHIQNISRAHRNPRTSCAKSFRTPMQTLKSVPPLKLPGYEAGSKPTPGGCPVSNHGVKHSHAVDGAVGGQFSWSNLVSFDAFRCRSRSWWLWRSVEHSHPDHKKFDQNSVEEFSPPDVNCNAIKAPSLMKGTLPLPGNFWAEHLL